MKLSDIMSATNLAIYAEVALVIFMAVFFLVAVHVFSRKNTSAWDHASRMPLSEPDDEAEDRGART
jgi:cbb3-type cytochrome oxidase subunit 3